LLIHHRGTIPVKAPRADGIGLGLALQVDRVKVSAVNVGGINGCGVAGAHLSVWLVVGVADQFVEQFDVLADGWPIGAPLRADTCASFMADGIRG